MTQALLTIPEAGGLPDLGEGFGDLATGISLIGGALVIFGGGRRACVNHDSPGH
jgi:hypothetical protein